MIFLFPLTLQILAIFSFWICLFSLIPIFSFITKQITIITSDSYKPNSVRITMTRNGECIHFNKLCISYMQTLFGYIYFIIQPGLFAHRTIPKKKKKKTLFVSTLIHLCPWLIKTEDWSWSKETTKTHYIGPDIHGRPYSVAMCVKNSFLSLNPNSQPKCYWSESCQLSYFASHPGHQFVSSFSSAHNGWQTMLVKNEVVKQYRQLSQSWSWGRQIQNIW